MREILHGDRRCAAPVPTPQPTESIESVQNEVAVPTATRPFLVQSRPVAQNDEIPDRAFEWSRSETLALSMHQCTSCHGAGLRLGNSKVTPCNCVLRSIFRACFEKFKQCMDREKYVSQVSLEPGNSRGGRMTWGRKNEEFVADFILVTKRTLTGKEYDIFRFHFLLGADWKLCSRRMKIDRGSFFHAVYRIEKKLGLVFRTLQPYALFPLDEYFNSTVRGGSIARPTPPAPAAERRALVPPLALPAVMAIAA